MRKYFDRYYLSITFVIAGLTAILYILGLPLGLMKLNVCGENIWYIFNMIALMIAAIGIMKVCYPSWIFGWSKSGVLKKLVLYGTEGILGALALAYFSYHAFQPLSAKPKIGFVFIWVIVYYFCVAVIEEVFMRGILLKAIIKKLRQEKRGVLLAVLISSMIFGLGHLPGMIQFDLQIAVQKMFWTISLGIYLGCIYTITRSLWVVILLHYFIDVAGGIFYYYSQNENAFCNGTVNLVICVLLGLSGFVRVGLSK